jgi:hypothetical protein
LEAAKLTAFRTLGGLSVPAYYASHVLPTYIAVVGIDVVPGRPRGSEVITYNGWRIFLRQKMLQNPDEMFMCIRNAAAALGVRLQTPLARTDFPAAPDPGAVALEQQFKTQIYSMLRGAAAMGAFGGGGHHAKPSHGHGNAEGKIASAVVKGLFKQTAGLLSGAGNVGAGLPFN